MSRDLACCAGVAKTASNTTFAVPWCIRSHKTGMTFTLPDRTLGRCYSWLRLQVICQTTSTLGPEWPFCYMLSTARSTPRDMVRAGTMHRRSTMHWLNRSTKRLEATRRRPRCYGCLGIARSADAPANSDLHLSSPSQRPTATPQPTVQSPSHHCLPQLQGHTLTTPPERVRLVPHRAYSLQGLSCTITSTKTSRSMPPCPGAGSSLVGTSRG